MLVAVQVGVALSRPPRLDEYRKVLVEVESETEAHLVAAQMSGCTCTMVVSTEIIEILEI